jgi:hypothetical protein
MAGTLKGPKYKVTNKGNFQKLIHYCATTITPITTIIMEITIVATTTMVTTMVLICNFKIEFIETIMAEIKNMENI